MAFTLDQYLLAGVLVLLVINLGIVSAIKKKQGFEVEKFVYGPLFEPADGGYKVIPTPGYFSKCKKGYAPRNKNANVEPGQTVDINKYELRSGEKCVYNKDGKKWVASRFDGSCAYGGCTNCCTNY